MPPKRKREIKAPSNPARLAQEANDGVRVVVRDDTVDVFDGQYPWTDVQQGATKSFFEELLMSKYKYDKKANTPALFVKVEYAPWTETSYRRFPYYHKALSITEEFEKKHSRGIVLKLETPLVQRLHYLLKEFLLPKFRERGIRVVMSVAVASNNNANFSWYGTKIFDSSLTKPLIDQNPQKRRERVILITVLKEAVQKVTARKARGV